MAAVMGSAVVPGLLELLREHRNVAAAALFFVSLPPAMLIFWKASKEWRR